MANSIRQDIRSIRRRLMLELNRAIIKHCNMACFGIPGIESVGFEKEGVENDPGLPPFLKPFTMSYIDPITGIPEQVSTVLAMRMNGTIILTVAIKDGLTGVAFDSEIEASLDDFSVETLADLLDYLNKSDWWGETDWNGDLGRKRLSPINWYRVCHGGRKGT